MASRELLARRYPPSGARLLDPRPPGPVAPGPPVSRCPQPCQPHTCTLSPAHTSASHARPRSLISVLRSPSLPTASPESGVSHPLLPCQPRNTPPPAPSLIPVTPGSTAGPPTGTLACPPSPGQAFCSPAALVTLSLNQPPWAQPIAPPAWPSLLSGHHGVVSVPPALSRTRFYPLPAFPPAGRSIQRSCPFRFSGKTQLSCHLLQAAFQT